MDSVKTPFKAGIRSEFSPSSMPHHHLNQTLLVSDEEWATEITGLVGDDFSVEDLLDMGAILEEVEFHPELEAREEEEEAEQEEGEEQEHRTQEEETNSSSGLSFEGLPATELLLPEGDISDLEWVSHFVEDCFSEFPTSAVSFPYHHLNSKPETLETHKPSSPSSSCLKRTMDKLAVPVKVRSKRSKTGGRVWSLLAPQLAEPTSSSSSSSSSSASSSSALSSSLVHENINRDLSLYCMKPPKKKGRKPKAAAGWTEGGGGGGAPWQRRCSHCGVQKTPQWRTGPLGAKTLCNACGVRYKSGRLVPEYRPAGSPTFLSHVHSNSHRKVLEMRRKKEELTPAPSTPIPRPPVHDCESLPSEQQPTEPVRSGPTGCSFGLV